MWQVIGQTRAVSLLQRSLEADSLAHAYLFVGPAHVGKMTLALNLAQALNCEAVQPPPDEVGTQDRPCGECLSCQKILTGKHADVQTILMDGEASEETRTRISVTQIEELQRAVSLPPFEGRRKVFIIDGAEMLSIGAANRLLKTLEEPVGDVVFLLLTVDDKLLPPTVVSRCQRIELALIPAAQIEEALKTKWAVEAEKAKLLSRLAHGCLGWAVSAARDDGLLQQRNELLEKLLDMINAGAEERFAFAAQLADQFSKNRRTVYGQLDLWLDWWRDLLLVKTGSVENITNVDRLETLTEMADGLSLGQIRAFIQSVRSTGDGLRRNAGAKLALDVLMLDIPETGKYGKVKSAV
ncbi:MAG TPA: DNA polymerase III subunit delta' [Dehalococcoidales bacterium]|nr:DNA polymerase III subunit delta' [Dehalococcoidales bacterium]